MKNTIRILGANSPQSTPKPIEVASFLNEDVEIDIDVSSIVIKDYKFITLICKNYFGEGENYPDLILLSPTENPSENPYETLLCIGKWNDGKL